MESTGFPTDPPSTGSPATPDSTEPTPSVTAILELIDPATLPAPVREDLQTLGPFLASGLTYRQIAERTGRSEDWVSTRVGRIRRALIDKALERADEIDGRLRRHLEELRRSSTA